MGQTVSPADYLMGAIVALPNLNGAASPVIVMALQGLNLTSKGICPLFELLHILLGRYVMRVHVGDSGRFKLTPFAANLARILGRGLDLVFRLGNRRFSLGLCFLVICLGNRWWGTRATP